jgi:hypothetical protein
LTHSRDEVLNSEDPAMDELSLLPTRDQLKATAPVPRAPSFWHSDACACPDSCPDGFFHYDCRVHGGDAHPDCPNFPACDQR